MQIFWKAQESSDNALLCKACRSLPPASPAKHVVIQTDKNLGHNHLLCFEKKTKTKPSKTDNSMHLQECILFLCSINPTCTLSSLITHASQAISCFSIQIRSGLAHISTEPNKTSLRWGRWLRIYQDLIVQLLPVIFHWKPFPGGTGITCHLPV